MAETDGSDQLHVGDHCSVGSDAGSTISNQIKSVWLCQYISKVMQGYTSSSGYKVNTSAEWKMANFCLFCHDITQNNNATIYIRTE